ncbi:MAG: penicillin-binding protein 1C [Pseudopedobacter saltans]|uniref:peptidoglycan glycosyltransferase n=1 Tax=Pseudopedobacter saltans TaxID=151895 RepID=A0A2W5F7L0_9SPHI|nr:MAG: penicillin-binding protein 1C [Pseudopedobacter saltans]
MFNYYKSLSRKKKIVFNFLLSVSFLFCFFLLADLCFPFHTQGEYAPVIRYRDGSPMHIFLTKDQQWRMKTELSEISPSLTQAIIAKEDKYFLYHPGVNVGALMRAIVQNVVHVKRISGASTITMQVARMLHPKQRTYGNKCLEIFHALLQMYLNMVPYGSNIQGVKAASILYFNKFPEQLSLAEVTTLSVIPNRPNSLVIGKDNATIVKVRNKWLHRFQKEKVFSENVIADALKETLNAQRLDAPKDIPQLAWRLRRAYPLQYDITSTVDPSSQQKAETIVENYSHSLAMKDIHNSSAIIVDNRTRSILAYIGSNDFSDIAHYGQVDGVMAVRSPGSSLKPLVYGLAFDMGFITSKTILTDIPVDFKGYTPENYDNKFYGQVSAENALQQSLNIPAVKLLNRVGIATFISHLQACGYQSVWKQRDKMGLSMILGGCGVRLDEMAGLYAMLANHGKYQQLHIVADSSVYSDKQVLSSSAAYMLTDILKKLQRPDLPNENVNAQDVPHIAWKTGTSYGRRDAWSIGYDDRFTIAVWCGNFSGKGNPLLNGAATATPLLFQLFNSVGGSLPLRDSVPNSLQFRQVCRLTGKVPNDFCTDLVIDAFIPGVSDNSVCDHLKEVDLSADEKFSYCTSCRPANGYKTKLFPNIDPELANYYEQNHIDYKKIPPHNPMCTRYFPGAEPIINSLTDGVTYLITDRGKQKLQLSCAAASDTKKVYWYVNDKFVGSMKKEDKLFFVPEANKIKVSCTDDKGRNKDIWIGIKFL